MMGAFAVVVAAVWLIILTHLAVDSNLGLVHTSVCSSMGGVTCVERWRLETRPYPILRGSDDYQTDHPAD